jgi:hypothetical protein
MEAGQATDASWLENQNRGPGKRWAVQLDPLKEAPTGGLRTGPSPTASQDPARKHATLRSGTPRYGFEGTGFSDHAVPFHAAATGTVRSAAYAPTAVHLLSDEQVTPYKYVGIVAID